MFAYVSPGHIVEFSHWAVESGTQGEVFSFCKLKVEGQVEGHAIVLAALPVYDSFVFKQAQL